MEGLRYLLLSLVLGGLSVWASENLFWVMPPPGLTLVDLALTVVAYSIAAAVALSAVIWAGLGGISAAFLGGAIMGYMSEGVIVGTIYEGVPLQMIWTPLSWHALVTGALVLGVGRAQLPAGRMVLIWAGLGFVGAYWAQFWTSERAGLPEPWLFALYIFGFGLVVPLAHVVMDWLGALPRPKPWVLGVAPAIAVAVWLLQTITTMNPIRLLLPAVLVLVLWVMRRLGQKGAPVALGSGPAARHGLFMIAPVVIVILAQLGWAQGLGTLEANWVVAGACSLAALIWLGQLIWRSAAKRNQGSV
jgi:hypothetical protein